MGHDVVGVDVAGRRCAGDDKVEEAVADGGGFAIGFVIFGKVFIKVYAVWVDLVEFAVGFGQRGGIGRGRGAGRRGDDGVEPGVEDGFLEVEAFDEVDAAFVFVVGEDFEG